MSLVKEEDKVKKEEGKGLENEPDTVELLIKSTLPEALADCVKYIKVEDNLRSIKVGIEAGAPLQVLTSLHEVLSGLNYVVIYHLGFDCSENLHVFAFIRAGPYLLDMLKRED
ncbi:MAG: hypothetical protein QXP27_04855 [Candidatus Methanomethyliaceae archaeon]